MSPDYNVEEVKATETVKPNGRAAPDEIGPGESAPDTIHESSGLSDDDIIQKALNAKNGQKFGLLLRGRWDSYSSQDNADAAFCMLLAYWTARDPERMDRIFRQSGLMRPKWDDKIGEQTYGQAAIQGAIAGTTEVYSGIQRHEELQRARKKLSELLELAKTSKDVEIAYQAAPFIAHLPAAETGPIKAKFKTVLGHQLNLNDLNRAISEAAREQKTSGHQATSGLPAITITDRPLREMSDEALAALYHANNRSDPPHIFVRANTLVRVTRDETMRPLIQDLAPAHLRRRLSDSADFFATGGKNEPKHKEPPENVVQDILTQGGWILPRIEAIVQTPIIRPDGTILSKPGYDQATHLVFVPAVPFHIPRIPDKPTQTDIERARERIEETICDFPFVDKASRANAFALMLTLILRQAIKKVPMALIDAPDSGTGKSLLAEVVCLVTTGLVPAMMTECESEEEWGKSITSVLLEGSTINIIDNVEHPLKSAKLAAVLTTQFWKHRLLGRNIEAALPSRATWIATGNNIRLGADMPRRCYLIRMDAGVERPYERQTFKHPDLTDWVSKNQGELLGALLTLARSWYAAGKPKANVAVVGGFEEWSRTAGGILEHVGVEGFLENRREVYDQSGDEEEEQWKNFFETLSSTHSDQTITSAEILSLVRSGRCGLYEVLPPSVAKFLSRNDEGFTRALGKAFAQREGRKYGNHGWHLQRVGQQGHAIKWRLVDTP